MTEPNGKKVQVLGSRDGVTLAERRDQSEEQPWNKSMKWNKNI